jgi:hypothetical protein
MAAPFAEAAVEIAAPIDVVWRVMTDLPRYREWNPFVVAIEPVDGAFRVGTAIALTVKWGRRGGASTIEVVDRLDAPARDGELQRALMEYRFVGWLPRLALVRGSRQQALEQRPRRPPRQGAGRLRAARPGVEGARGIARLIRSRAGPARGLAGAIAVGDLPISPRSSSAGPPGQAIESSSTSTTMAASTRGVARVG